MDIQLANRKRPNVNHDDLKPFCQKLNGLIQLLNEEQFPEFFEDYVSGIIGWPRLSNHIGQYINSICCDLAPGNVFSNPKSDALLEMISLMDEIWRYRVGMTSIQAEAKRSLMATNESFEKLVPLLGNSTVETRILRNHGEELVEFRNNCCMLSNMLTELTLRLLAF